MDDHRPAGFHSIRLSSAWDPPSGDETSWRRRFGRPAGIAAGDRVVLVIEGPRVAAVALNGRPLPAPVVGSDRGEHDVAPLLQDRNLLVVQSALDGLRTSPHRVDAHGRTPLPDAIGRVALEILTAPATER